MNFPLVPLINICQINMGQAPSGSSYNEESIGLPLIAGAADFGATSPRPKKFTSKPSKITEQGDIILCIRATIGDLNWSDKQYCLGRGVAGLRVNDKELDSGYLWHFISSHKQQLSRLGTGSTFKQINRKVLEELKVPLPPLNLQRHISKVLGQVDQLCKQAEQVETELNQLAQSMFLEMFGDPSTNAKGWAWGTIRDLVSYAKYGTSAKASETEGEFPILRMNNITYEGGWDFTSMKYVDLTEKEQEKYLVHAGELLFNRTNSKELVGKTAVYREEKPVAVAGYLVRVGCNEKANPEYISAYMNSKHGKLTLQSMCKSIVGMANINAQEFQDIKILIPPKDLQDEFAERVQVIRQQVAVVRDLQESHAELFQALTQKAFKGELKLPEIVAA